MKQISISLLLLAFMSNLLLGQVLVLNNYQSSGSSCPLMEVRMTESNNNGFYTVSYCNHGNTLATNVYIELYLNDGAEIVQSPYIVSSMQNNLYRINLPNALATQCLDFDIKIKMSNPAITNCTKVFIYPNDPCQTMIDYYLDNNLNDIMGGNDDDDDDDDDDDNGNNNGSGNNITSSTISQNQDLRGGIRANPLGSSTINSIFEDNVMLSGSPIWDSIFNVFTNSNLTVRPNNGSATLNISTSIKGGDNHGTGQNSTIEIEKLVWAEYCENKDQTITSSTTSAIDGTIPFVGVINGFSTASNTIQNEVQNAGIGADTNLEQSNFEKEELDALEIAVYPNPFNSQTTIEIIGNDFKNKTFVLLDATGKMIKNISFQSPKIILQKENLISGLYFYQIIKEGQIEKVGKLIAY